MKARRGVGETRIIERKRPVKIDGDWRSHIFWN